MNRMSLLVLGFGAFVIGTYQMMLGGILPQLASSFDVSASQAGQMMTVFGIAAAVLGPVLATATVRARRRTVLVLAVGLYLLGTGLTASSGSFALALLAQVPAAAGAGLFVPTATATAATLVPAARQGRAVAHVSAGTATAIAGGAPISTALASLVGWRGSMLALCGVGAALGAGLLVAASRAGAEAIPPKLSERVGPLRDWRVALLLTTTVFAYTAIYIPYTYISLIFTPATGGDGISLAVLLAALGIAGVASNVVAGSLIDRIGPIRVMGVALVGVIAVFAAIPLLSNHYPAAVVLAALYGFFGFGVSAPQTVRLVRLNPAMTPLTVALNAAFIYLSTSLSGALGAVVIETLGVPLLSLVAAGLAAVAVGLSQFAHRKISRGTNPTGDPGLGLSEPASETTRRR